MKQLPLPSQNLYGDGYSTGRIIHQLQNNQVNAGSMVISINPTTVHKWVRKFKGQRLSARAVHDTEVSKDTRFSFIFREKASGIHCHGNY